MCLNLSFYHPSPVWPIIPLTFITLTLHLTHGVETSHKTIDESCIYISKYHIVVCYYFYNIDNLLHCIFSNDLCCVEPFKRVRQYCTQPIKRALS